MTMFAVFVGAAAVLRTLGVAVRAKQIIRECAGTRRRSRLFMNVRGNPDGKADYL